MKKPFALDSYETQRAKRNEPKEMSQRQSGPAVGQTLAAGTETFAESEKFWDGKEN